MHENSANFDIAEIWAVFQTELKKTNLLSLFPPDLLRGQRHLRRDPRHPARRGRLRPLHREVRLGKCYVIYYSTVGLNGTHFSQGQEHGGAQPQAVQDPLPDRGADGQKAPREPQLPRGKYKILKVLQVSCCYDLLTIYKIYIKIKILIYFKTYNL